MISIIIVVKNDREIENTLKKLTNCHKPGKTEILVVDASFENFLDDIKGKFHNVRWLYYTNNSTKKKSIAEQRNLGIENAKGDIIVFIDSNCIPSNNWLFELLKPIINQNEVFVKGKVISLNKNIKHYDELFNKIQNNNYLDDCGTANIAFKKIY